MIRRVILGVAVMLGGAVWAAAGESSITYRVHFDNPGPFGTKEIVSGSVWIDWTAPQQGQPGVAVSSGAFVLCMDGFGAFFLPDEPITDQLEEPLPPGRTPWVEGRRPPWIAGGQDGFRNPPTGGTFGLTYFVGGVPGRTCIGANIADQGTGIVFAQLPGTAIDELLLDDASFELFRFRLETPESGEGELHLLTTGGGAGHYTQFGGVSVPFDAVFHVGASITASSAEFVGEFWLGQACQGVI